MLATFVQDNDSLTVWLLLQVATSQDEFIRSQNRAVRISTALSGGYIDLFVVLGFRLTDVLVQRLLPLFGFRVVALLWFACVPGFIKTEQSLKSLGQP